MSDSIHACTVAVEIRDGARGAFWTKHGLYLKAFEACSNFVAERPEFSRHLKQIRVVPGTSMQANEPAAMMVLEVEFTDPKVAMLQLSARCPRSHGEYVAFAASIVDGVAMQMQDAADRTSLPYLRVLAGLRKAG